MKLGDEKLAYDKQWVIVNATTIEVRGDACARLDAAPVKGRFPWSAHEVGLLFVFSGILGIFLQGGLLGRLVKKFGEAKLVILGFAFASVGYALIGFTYSLGMLLVCAAMNSFGNGVLRPALTSQITQVAGRAEQGVAIGISGSLSSLAMMMAPPTGGTLLNREWLVAWAMIPASVAALGLLAALISRKPRPAATPASGHATDELSSAP